MPPFNSNDPAAQARSAAIRKLGIARKPSGFVRRYLAQLGYEASVIEEVIEHLHHEQYLDDRRLATSKIKSRKGARTESNRLTAQRLRQIGLESSAVDLAILDRPDDRELAGQALEAKFKNEIGNNATTVPPEIQAKMKRFLLSRGFSAAITRDTIRTYLNGSAETDDRNFY